MCGIAGIFDLSQHAERHRDAIERGTEALFHRGPDGAGLFVDGPVALGFRRLAIIDLTDAGNQPMTSQDGDWTVVFNGEIFNYIELRDVLQKQGVGFHSTSDSEVLVEALAHWGPTCFERFNGMWAVLAWQRSSQTMLACRDPWGIKPLYMSGIAGHWIGFSSEIKGLRAMGCPLGAADGVAARRFLEQGEMDVDQRTLFANVTRLQPGMFYRFEVGRPYQTTRFGDGTQAIQLPAFPETAAGEANYVEVFRAAFVESVRLRLRADVDVGTCLSGGLDSTAIACAAAQLLDAGASSSCRHAFTAMIPEYDESQYVQAVVQQTGADWRVTVADDRQIRGHAEAFFKVHDQPVHSLAPLAGYLVFNLAAAAKVRVLLNGQGGDEVLAGYFSCVLPYLRSVLHDDGLASGLRQAIAEGGSVAKGLSLLLGAESGRLLRRSPAFVENSIRTMRPRLINGSKYLPIRVDGPLGFSQPRSRPPTDSLRVALDDQVARSPLPMYLRIEDLNSSAYSLEARLPFLDPSLVALARAAPARMLRENGLNKQLLRRILPGLVPDIVWQRRDKMGFPVPTDRWLRGPLRDMFADTLSEARLLRRGWYDVPKVVAQVDQFLSNSTSNCPIVISRIFLLERWARDWIDG